MRVFLGADGIAVRAPTADGLDLMIRLANGQVDVEGIAAFLAGRAQAADGNAEAG